MATIVQHKPSGEHYVVIGTGYGAWAAVRPSVLSGGGIARVNTGSAPLIAVVGEKGEIGWLPTDEVTVITVDGKSPHEHLHPPAPYR